MLNEKQYNKPRLSKGILEMKFMQSTKMKLLKENEAIEGQTMYASEITDKMIKSNSNFIIETSYVPCENLIVGRLSFRGMNPEIERQMELEREEKLNSSKRPEQSAEVSNKEMLELYQEKQQQHQASSVSKTIEKKFCKNKHKKNTKKRSYPEGSPVIDKKKQFIKSEKTDDE